MHKNKGNTICNESKRPSNKTVKYSGSPPTTKKLQLSYIVALTYATKSNNICLHFQQIVLWEKIFSQITPKNYECKHFLQI